MKRSEIILALFIAQLRMFADWSRSFVPLKLLAHLPTIEVFHPSGFSTLLQMPNPGENNSWIKPKKKVLCAPIGDAVCPQEKFSQ